MPGIAVVATGVVGVFVAMNVLVTATPVAITASSSPSASPAPSFPGTPSALPFVTPTTLAIPVQSAALPPAAPLIVHSAISASDPGGTWTVYLGYPGLVEGSSPWADDIDAAIVSEMDNRAAAWEQGPAAIRRSSGKKNTLYGSFTTELLTPAFASFTVTWTDDSSDREPAVGVETFTYDLGTGQRLSLTDLFLDTSAALAIVSSTAVSLLQDELGAGFDPDLVSQGTGPSLANYVNWAITPDGVKITFSQYQVTATATALPSIVVGWGSLRSVLVQTGPIAKLAGF